MTKIISIVNQKGGTGKSACTANYGVGLARMKKKVLVVDVILLINQCITRAAHSRICSV